LDARVLPWINKIKTIKESYAHIFPFDMVAAFRPSETPLCPGLRTPSCMYPIQGLK
jgi:hypothetical protein